MEYFQDTRSVLDIVNLLEARNGKLIGNIAHEAVGHLLPEFDNFQCMKALGEVSADGFHLYLGPRMERTEAIAELYGGALCSGYILTDYALEMARSISHFRPDLVADVGVSSDKMAPIPGRTDTCGLRPEGYFDYISTNAALEEDFAAYYRRKRATGSKNFMARNFEMSAELDDLIGAGGKRLALVQHKEIGLGGYHSTGVAESTDPQTYVPALEYLLDQGLHPVHVGREPYPDCYRRLGVVDYANSPLASFRNDFALFANADVAIMGSSGVNWFAELMGMPFVIANTWSLNMPAYSPHCVVVPTLAKDRESGEYCSIRELFDFRNRTGVYFPTEHFQPVNCDGDDILEATREALKLGNEAPPFSAQQQIYDDISSTHPCSRESQIRLSAAFAERYEALLN